MSVNWKHLKLGSVVVFGSMLLALLLLEVFARTFPDLINEGAVRSEASYHYHAQAIQQEMRDTYNSGRKYTFLPEYNHILVGRPNLTYTRYGHDYTAEVSFNSMGLRAQEPAAGAGRKTVLFMGDSIVEGSQVDASATMAQQLENKLNTKEQDGWRVINAGISGTGTRNERDLLAYAGPAYKPDCVVLLFYGGNDYMNNSLFMETLRRGIFTTNRAFLYPQSADEYTFIPPHARLEDVLSEEEYAWYVEKVTPARECMDEAKDFSSKTRRFLQRNVELFNIYRRFKTRYLDSRGDCAQVEGIHVSEIMESQSIPNITDPIWQVTMKLLKDTEEKANDMGAKFMVVYLPNRKYLEADTLYSSQKFMELCDRNDLKCYDLGEQLHNLPDPYVMFQKIDGHFNEKGHEFVADFVYDKMEMQCMD